MKHFPEMKYMYIIVVYNKLFTRHITITIVMKRLLLNSLHTSNGLVETNYGL